MHTYVIFYKNKSAKVVHKENVTQLLNKELKQKGFRKHPIEVDAENEKEAISTLNEDGVQYLNELGAFSGNVFFYCASILVVCILIVLNL